MMKRTELEVVEILKEMYKSEFGGKKNQRFLISKAQLKSIYGYEALHDTRVALLQEEAAQQGLYVLDLGLTEPLGQVYAVVRSRTALRWRRVPKNVIEKYVVQSDVDTTDEDDLD